MTNQLVEQILETWRTNNRITLLLLRAVPKEGLAAVPLNSRGRTVAEQFAHLHSVRVGWLAYNTGKQPGYFYGLPARTKLGRPALAAALRSSGNAVETLLQRTIAAGAKVKAFRGNPVRWLGYLIAHDAHHRGQILLALKQNQMRLPDRVSRQGMWATWVWGKM